LISNVVIPELGATGGDVELLEWLVEEGQFVRAGTPILTVSTDKATVEIEAFRDGYLNRILAPAGSQVELGAVVATIADELDDAPPTEPRAQMAFGTDASDRIPGPYSEPVDIYRRMVLIRRFEDYLYRLFLQGLVPGTLHQCQGQEATAVGVCSVLRQDDVVFSTHRPVGHALAKGASLRGITAEIWGKATGCAGGKGGQMHLSDIAVGFMPSNAIVGANAPIATGAAIGFKLRGIDSVAVSFFGDGASNIGALHEAVNLAAVKKAPVIFVCENNLYAASTSIALTSLVSDLAERANGYGVPGFTVDGMDVEAVADAAESAVTRAREGGGPTFIECKTYRYCGHSRGDPMGYRTEDELRVWRERDPISRYRRRMIEDFGITEADADRIDEECQLQVESAVEYAMSSPDPEPDTVFSNVYAPREVRQ